MEGSEYVMGLTKSLVTRPTLRLLKVQTELNPHWMFLDLDGTIADSLPGIQFSICAAFAALGKPMPSSDLRSLIGPGIRKIFTRIDPALASWELDVLEKHYRHSYDTYGCLEATLYPGVRATLEELLCCGAQLFIVTNKPRRATLNVLDNLQLTSYFREVLTLDSSQPPYESKGRMLRELIAKYGVDPSRAQMVGDTVEDKNAAEEVKIRFIFAAYGYGIVEGCGGHTIDQFSSLPVPYDS
jgi:phosphoglycolate phosphatase